MPSNEEIFKRIIEAIEKKNDRRDFRCVICDHNNWHIPQNYTFLFATKDASKPTISGRNFPLVPLICTNCGNTHLINLKVLGFDDLASLVWEEEKEKEDSAKS